MADRKEIISARTLSYSGIFDGKEIYKHLRGTIKEFGYDDWLEKEHSEKNTKTHKQVEIMYLPSLQISDYIKLQIRIDITYMNLKHVTVDYKGKKLNADEGELELVFRGYLISDYENRWEGKQHWFFLRAIMDKFIMSTYYSKYEKMLSEHIKELYNSVRQYLNTTKHA